MAVRQARPEDAQRIAEIHTASWRATFRDIMPADFLARQDVEHGKAGWLRNLHDHPGNLLVFDVAPLGVLGFACSGPVVAPSAFDGQIFGIHVAPAAKRRGYGRQLMAAAFGRLASLECKNAFLLTLEKNAHARLFYEALGGVVVERQPVVFGGRELVELVYAWEDLTLAGKAASHATVEIRDAVTEDAPAACQVMWRSITELCADDHANDPTFLARWLVNKTPEIVASWITRSDNSVLVAVEGNAILAVGAVTDAGEITLNYVSPDARFRGVGKAMLGTLETRATERGNIRCTLTSTETARRFYEANGYRNDGASTGKFGMASGYPMTKSLAARDL